MVRDPQLKSDLDRIIDDCTGVGDILDELSLLRVSLRAYVEGMNPGDAVAYASEQLSNSITQHNPRP